MRLIIVLFGLFIVVMAAVLLLRPNYFTRWMLDRAETIWLYAGAIGGRLVLGAALLGYSGQSRFPTVLQVFGWIALAAALGLTLMGRDRFTQLVHGAFERFGRFTRGAGFLAILFGAFLIYAVV